MSNHPFYHKITKKHIVLAVFITIAVLFGFFQWQRIVNEKIAAYTETLSDYEERFQHYYYDDYKNTYNTLIGNYKTALDSKDLSVLENCSEELTSLETKVIKENTSLFKETIETLENANLMNAYEEELTQIAQIQSKVQNHLEQHTFTEITPLIEEWTAILSKMTVIADNLSIYVNQSDFSSYPEISLYLDIRNIETNETPTGLEKEYLYLTEYISTTVSDNKDAELNTNTNTASNNNIDIASTTYECTVQSLEQLANELPLSITIAADMENAKTDEEITTIQTAIADFTKQVSSSTIVNETVELDTSCLYDSLLELIPVSASAKGAKCIIIFTSAEDTDSTHTWNDVVSLSKEYGVPIFIIGIGKEVSPYILERIGTQTNGFYRNINDYASLGKVFEKVYDYMTGLYKVTFVPEIPKDTQSTNANETTDTSDTGEIKKHHNLHIAYKHRDYGGSCDYEYTMDTEKAGN